ncbi:hypothetical protein ACIQUQ_10395 [Streptomyces sp. NPDC101118]|uniref:hypothetical protein n=1 Tax=Streptomyces sp. NPDC101118 TaxID=3366109 RepID=UPI003803E666
MSGTRYVLTKALVAVCLVLLTLLGGGTPATAAPAGACPAPTAPAAPAAPALPLAPAPAEGPGAPGGSGEGSGEPVPWDTELRFAVRHSARGAEPRTPAGRTPGGTPAPEPPAAGVPRVRSAAPGPGASLLTVRCVVLRC